MVPVSPPRLVMLSVVGFASFSLLSCNSGGDECTSAEDCSEGLSCVDGSCVVDSSSGSPGNPAITDQCMVDADCANPPSACSSSEGASCVDGVCEYLELSCDSPPPDRCIDGGTILVRSGSSGTCDEDAGGCVYEEEEISVDPANCEAIAAGGCEAVECPDTDCGINGLVELGSPSCECTYAMPSEAGTACEDLTTLCTTASSCDGEGGCQNTGVTIEAGRECIFNGSVVVDLDENGLPTTPDEPREEGAPMPFCETDGGRCIECTDADAATQCDDGNPCTQDSCNDGICFNLEEPQNNAECTLEEGETGLFGDVGVCADGACVQCNSAIPDASLRDAACVRQDSSGEVNACLAGASCVNDRCEYDVDRDDAMGDACLDDAGDAGVCVAGSCAQCITDEQCEDDGNQCTDVVCRDNACVPEAKPDTDSLGRPTTCINIPGDPMRNFCVAGTCIPCSTGDSRENGSSGTFPPPSACNRWRAFLKDGVPVCDQVADETMTGESCNRDLCTGMICSGGSDTEMAQCDGQPVSCDGTCEGTCDPTTGRCSPTPGVSCDDLNLCTQNDQCSDTTTQCVGQTVSGCCRSDSDCDDDERCLLNRCREIEPCGGRCNAPCTCNGTQCLSPDGQPVIECNEFGGF